jgi:small-conductance mechanosensitive channel
MEDDATRISSAITALEQRLKTERTAEDDVEMESMKTLLDDVTIMLDLYRMDHVSDTARKQSSTFARRLRKCRSDWEYLTAIPTNLATPSEKEQVIALGRQLQTESISSLQRCISTVHETTAVANMVSDRLQAQHEQIDRMHGGVQAIDNHNRRALQTLRRLSRRVAQSKIVQCLSGVVAVGVATIVGLKVS